MDNSDIIIETTDQLKSLIKSYRFHLVPRSMPRIVVRLNTCSETENRELNGKVNSWYYSCGCREGAAALLVCLVFCAYYFFCVMNRFHFSYLMALTVLMFISIATGKALGILIDRYRLGRLVKKLSGT